MAFKLIPMIKAVTLSVMLLLGVGTAAHADDFALPASTEGAAPLRLYGTYYHQLNQRTVSKTAPYGRGSSGYVLVPFRSIAADKRIFPPGTALYIPELRGMTFTLDGQTLTHDGYVLVADSGGGVHGHHIDFFTGRVHGNPASHLFAGRAHHFSAQKVTDPAVIAALRSLHGLN